MNVAVDRGVYSRMKRCEGVSELLSLYAGGDLSSREVQMVQTHLGTCAPCASELNDYRRVTQVCAEAFEDDGSLSPVVIGRIAARAAEQASRAPWWVRLLPLTPAPGLGAAVPVALLLLAITLPLALRPDAGAPAMLASPVRIDMQLEGDAVRLAWSDGRGRPYKVFKSTDPRHLGEGRGQLVNGNQWVDRELESSPIVYYRVE